MAELSAGEAIASGFRLIGRNPAAIFWWALAYLILAVAPQLLAFAVFAPDMLGAYQRLAHEGAAGAGTPDMAGMAALQSHMLLLQPVSLITALVSHAVLLGAVYRGVLFPEERRFGGVRFSMREVWLGLVTAVLYVAFAILCVVVAVVVAVAVAGAAVSARHGGGAGVGGIVAGLFVLAAIGLVIWLLARFCLALPMSFERRTFVMEESWALTRGHAATIILVGVAIFVVLLLLEIVVVGVIVAAVVAVFGAPAPWTSWGSRPAEVFRTVLPWAPLVAVVASLFVALFYGLAAAPVADIYRQLTGGPKPA